MVEKKGIEPLDRAAEEEKKIMVEVICPNCNFTKEIPQEKIPPGVKWARCPRCKNRIEIFSSEPGSVNDDAHTGGGKDEKEARVATPWENRDELGLFQGAYQTFKAVLFSPERTFRTMTVKGGYGEPLVFGLLLGTIGTMFGFFWQFLMFLGGVVSMAEGLIGSIGMVPIFIGILILSPIFVLINMIISSGILHACLLVLKSGRSGFEGTFRVIAYSQSTQMFSLVPFAGGFVAWLWQLIVMIIGLKEIHDISYLRVVIAFLIPVAAIILIIVAVVISLIAFL